jgi:porphobilinogen deaminase
VPFGATFSQTNQDGVVFAWYRKKRLALTSNKMLRAAGKGALAISLRNHSEQQRYRELHDEVIPEAILSEIQEKHQNAPESDREEERTPTKCP